MKKPYAILTGGGAAVGKTYAMTPTELANELLAKRAAATPGPWKHTAGIGQAQYVSGPGERDICGEARDYDARATADYDFITFCANHAEEIALALREQDEQGEGMKP